MFINLGSLIDVGQHIRFNNIDILTKEVNMAL